MTELVAREARSSASVDTEIIAVNPIDSPPAIQGPKDGDAALPYLIELFDEKLSEDDFDAVIIACFDDTGLWQLKKRTHTPVIGIGEAGFHAAMLFGERFTVVTTLPISVPVIEKNIFQQGISSRCATVRASNIPVLELEADPKASMKRIAEEIEEAVENDQCDAIILGCAGMADIAKKLQSKFNLPIIDGVKTAVIMSEMLANIRS